MIYADGIIDEKADYVVRIIKSDDEKSGLGPSYKEEYSTWVNTHKKGGRLITYKVVR
jgi:hypothetical protein